jgi:hypothetical protein
MCRTGETCAGAVSVVVFAVTVLATSWWIALWPNIPGKTQIIPAHTNPNEMKPKTILAKRFMPPPIHITPTAAKKIIQSVPKNLGVIISSEKVSCVSSDARYWRYYWQTLFQT